MQETETPGIPTGVVRRPYNKNITVFREAVYSDPDLVSLTIPVEHEAQHPVLWLADMRPGDVIRVTGTHANREWEAVLTCEPGGKFTVKPIGPEWRGAPAELQ